MDIIELLIYSKGYFPPFVTIKVRTAYIRKKIVTDTHPLGQ
jgi:hypothetical protein